MASVPNAVHLIQAVEQSGLDWISNPWHTAGTFQNTWSGDYELREMEMHWSRTPGTGPVQDDDICTFHFLNLTSGVPDASWTTTDYTTVESAADAFWTAILGRFSGEYKLSEYVWRADGPAFKPFGASFSPTLRTTLRSVVGSGTSGSALPPQCALTVTEVTAAKYTAYGVGVPGHAPGTGRTQIRNRWGRFYLPALTNTNLSWGRVVPATCTAISSAVQTFYNACVSAQIVPVMYSPTTGNAWSIDEVRVDDIVDVIRSRRFITPTLRAPNTINPS